jgi:very-short-patch-repair endonuclease
LIPLPKGEGNTDWRDGYKIAGYCTMYMHAKKKEFARYLRKEETFPEKVMWEIFKDRRFCGLKFRRQHVLVGFIADFYCHERRLIVELDGWRHIKQKDYDCARDEILLSEGYSIIRFRNDEVVGDLKGVLLRLRNALTPSPLSQRERGIPNP